MMFKINFAQQVLSNPERRSEYDYERENPESGFHSFGEYDFTRAGGIHGENSGKSKVMHMLLNVTRIQHSMGMLFKHQTKAGVWLCFVYNDLEDSQLASKAFAKAVTGLGIVPAMAIGEEHGGLQVAHDYAYSRPAPAIFLLLDGAPIVFEGNASNATAIAEFASSSVPFQGELVVDSAAESMNWSHKAGGLNRAKMVFYTQKGEVPLLVKMMSVKFGGLVDIVAQVSATRGDVPTGVAQLPALVGFVPTDGDLKMVRFVGQSTEGEISVFLDALVPWHGVTIPGNQYSTIRSFLQDKKLMSKMLVLSGSREVDRQVRALSGEFKGKMMFATCLNTTERQDLMSASYVGNGIEYAGWSTLLYQNSETQPKEFDSQHISMLSRVLHLYSAPVPDLLVHGGGGSHHDASDHEPEVDIAKAKLLALQLRGQGQIGEAKKIEAAVAKWERTAPLSPDTGGEGSEDYFLPGSAGAAEAELLEMIRLLRANGQEEKAREAEQTLARIKGAGGKEL